MDNYNNMCGTINIICEGYKNSSYCTVQVRGMKAKPVKVRSGFTESLLLPCGVNNIVIACYKGIGISMSGNKSYSKSINIYSPGEIVDVIVRIGTGANSIDIVHRGSQMFQQQISMQQQMNMQQMDYMQQQLIQQQQELERMRAELAKKNNSTN